MRKFNLKMRVIPIFLILSMLLSSYGFASAESTITSDIKGHWAEKQLVDWKARGLINGYGDGSFKPNQTISRAEILALINRAFGFVETADISFSDLNHSDWEYNDVQKAIKAGYLQGYEDNTIRTKNQISRQEVAVIVQRLLGLSATEDNVTSFIDSQSIAAWSKKAVTAAAEKNIMSGYNDNSYKPEKAITRAEAVVTLERALQAKTVKYTKAGIYGPASLLEVNNGDVVIEAADVTLQNLVINGKLLIAESVGEGNVYLNNVTVKGVTTINGGGSNSIHFNNSTLLTVIVNKKAGDVRIVAEGTTNVKQIDVQSSAKIESNTSNGTGFDTVTMSGELPLDSKVTLSGAFDHVDIQAKSIHIHVLSGSINQMRTSTESKDLAVNLDKDVKIQSLEANANMKVSGAGTIDKAVMNNGGSESTFEKPPTVNEYKKDGVITSSPTPKAIPTPTPDLTTQPGVIIPPGGGGAPAGGGNPGNNGGDPGNTGSSTPTPTPTPIPIYVNVNGVRVTFNVDPRIDNGNTFVELKPILQMLGFQTAWDAGTQKLTANKTGLELIITANKSYFINGVSTLMDIAPILVDGSLLVPLRFIGDVSRSQVTWNSETKTVDIIPPVSNIISVTSITNSRIEIVTDSMDANSLDVKLYKKVQPNTLISITKAVQRKNKSHWYLDAPMTAGIMYTIKDSTKTIDFVANPADATVTTISYATALTSTNIRLVFPSDSRIDEDTIATSDFTIDKGVAVVKAEVDTDYNENKYGQNFEKARYAILLTTSTQLSGALYTVTINHSMGNTKLKNIAGIAIASNSSKEFTGIGEDTIAPIVSSAVATSKGYIIVNFTESSLLDITSATNKNNYSIDGLTVSNVLINRNTIYSSGSNDHSVKVYVNENMLNGNAYTVKINGIKDVLGNQMQGTVDANFSGVVWKTSFLKVLLVVSTSNTSIEISFDDAVGTGALNPYNYTIQGLTVIDAKYKEVYDQQHIILTTSPQENSKLYSVQLANLTDDARTPNALDPTTLPMAFGGRGPVEIVLPAAPITVTRADSTTNHVTVTFNKAVDITSASNVLNYKFENQLGAPTAAIVDSTGTKVILTVSNMVNGKLYYVIVTGVMDTDGYAITSINRVPFGGTN